jgi:TfoX/Sxy family transcriptional regulator of competence genes
MSKTGKKKPARKWRPATAAWIKVFAEVSAGLGEPRQMFGYPCAFVNGNMYAALHEAGLVLRLSAPEREELLRLNGASQFQPMPGRVMREYVVAPENMVNQPEAVALWVRNAFECGSSLPGKRSKARARRKTE